MFMVPLAGAEKNLLRAVQKDPEARRAKKTTSGGVLSVRREPIER
jgi:hypothetical protein